jgi:hypothetical protein
LRLLVSFEKLGQGVELRLPESAVLADPGGSIFHRRGCEAAAVHAASNFTVEQPGGFENAEVFGDSRKRDLKGFRKLGDGSLAESEAREDGATGGIGESAKGGIEGGSGIVNHIV